MNMVNDSFPNEISFDDFIKNFETDLAVSKYALSYAKIVAKVIIELSSRGMGFSDIATFRDYMPIRTMALLFRNSLVDERLKLEFSEYVASISGVVKISQADIAYEITKKISKYYDDTEIK
jgi:hypothetical protein